MTCFIQLPRTARLINFGAHIFRYDVLDSIYFHDLCTILLLLGQKNVVISLHLINKYHSL